MSTPELHFTTPPDAAPVVQKEKALTGSHLPTSRYIPSLRTSHVVAAGLLASVFFFFSALIPLAHTSIWGHLKYGQWIVENGALPTEELFSPFADPEQTYGNFQWLGQVVLCLVYHTGELFAGGDEVQRTAGGVLMLRTLHGLLIALKVAFLMLALQRSVRSMPLAIAGAALYVLMGFTSNQVQSPQVFGEVFFVFLLWWVSGTHWPRRSWLVIALLFAVWVNCHPSFLVGLALLAAFWTGRLSELSPSRPAGLERDAWKPAWVWQGMGLLMLAALTASVFNPHGREIYPLIVELLRQPNMLSLPDWTALDFSGGEEEPWIYWGSVLLLVLSQLASPRALPLSRLLVLLGFAVLPPWLQGMLPWWLMLVPWLAVVLWRNTAAVLPRFWRRFRSRTRVWKTKLALLLLATSVLGSVVWQVVLIQLGPTPLSASVTSATLWPLAMQLKEGKGMPALAEALSEYPQQRFQGRMLVHDTVADYLLWSLPAQAPLLVYSQPQHFSEKHWKGYLSVLSAAKANPEDQEQPGWEQILINDQVNLVVINLYAHAELANALRNDPAWIILPDESESSVMEYWSGFAEARLLIAVRRHPLLPE